MNAYNKIRNSAVSLLRKNSIRLYRLGERIESSILRSIAEYMQSLSYQICKHEWKKIGILEEYGGDVEECLNCHVGRLPSTIPYEEVLRRAGQIQA